MRLPYLLFRNVKIARTATGLSQKGLAAKIGVSDKTVSAYETGRAIPPTAILTKISEVTGTTLHELLGIREKNGEMEVFKKLEELDEKMSKIENYLAQLASPTHPRHGQKSNKNFS